MKKTLKIATPKQKIVVIYHGECPDGFASAWAAWTKFGNKAAYIGARDRSKLPVAIKNKEVYLIDYTYQPDLIKKLIKDNIRVTAIDHHMSQETSIKMTQDYSYDLHHSGAVLAWNYFHPGKKIPRVLLHVEDRDLWKWKLPHSKEILMVLDLLPFEFKAWNKFMKEMEDPKRRPDTIKRGELLFQHYQSLYRKILSNAQLVSFEGKKVYALDCPYYFADDLGHELATKTKSFAILWHARSDGRIKVSLRAIRGVNVGKIAVKYGGGGHHESAAFLIPAGSPMPWKLISK